MERMAKKRDSILPKGPTRKKESIIAKPKEFTKKKNGTQSTSVTSENDHPNDSIPSKANAVSVDDKPKKKTTTPDPVILSETDKIEEIDDGKPRAVIKSAPKRRNKKNLADPSQADSGLPLLWVRSNTGVVHLLDAPISAEPDGKQRGAQKYIRTYAAEILDRSFFAAKPESAGKKSSVPEVEVLGNLAGVKITHAIDTDGMDLKAEQVEEKLLQQAIQIEEQAVAKQTAAKKYYEAVKKTPEKKKPVVVRRVLLKKENKNLNLEHMFHTPHPNLMSPLFDLPKISHILFGPYEGQVLAVEEQVWQKSTYRGPERMIFPGTN